MVLMAAEVQFIGVLVLVFFPFASMHFLHNWTIILESFV